MTSYIDKMRRGENPIVATKVNELDDKIDLIYELKFGLVFYVDYPPGPKRAREVYDLYMAKYGGRVKEYIATIPGALVDDWTSATRLQFESEFLPRLREGLHWGYGFSDGNALNSYLFMFHGYRPAKEKGKASFFRFEFPWNVDQVEVRDFAIEVSKRIPFENGFGGYFLKVAPEEPESLAKMYAICRRFWGIEAWDLDESVEYVLQGYLSVNWLTFIGNSLKETDLGAIDVAKREAAHFFETPNGVVFQASEHALLGDRHRGEDMSKYIAVARALFPLQLKTFGSFGGERWDELSSFAWIRRFTHPDEFK
jgi:hypothetical protein